MNTDAKVILWGNFVGAVSWLDRNGFGVFQYTPDFAGSGIQLSPLMMPLTASSYEFPELSRQTFKGLPGLLADCLPDKFGNAVIDAWLTTQGRTLDSLNPVERLCYIGRRGMGALEFEPTLIDGPNKDRTVDVESLASLANQVLDQRTDLKGLLNGEDDKRAMEDILRVGTSAGGARAKAILAWNPATGEFRSGQGRLSQGFEHWLLKFDGVSNNRDKELADPQGYGKIEYAYHLMAVQAGIAMAACRLHKEGGRSHFMTRRFDRTPEGGKLHMQSLGALAHFDFNSPGIHSYEQAVAVIKRLDLPAKDREQIVRRAFFNVVARNQDDHVKNIAFLMDQQGKWSLAPAYDVTYSYNPGGSWTGSHQMSLNGKLDNFSESDLLALAAYADIKKGAARELLSSVLCAVEKWPQFAEQAGVPQKRIRQIGQAFRSFPKPASRSVASKLSAPPSATKLLSRIHQGPALPSKGRSL